MSDIPSSSKKLLHYLRDHLTVISNPKEVESISFMILEHLFSITRTDILMDRSLKINGDTEKTIMKYVSRLNDHEPIQYIIGQADFYGRKFIVNPNVLIPRGETEELVELVLDEYQGKRVRLLDVGTGSGCIPITIARERKESKCYAMDIDPRAMKIARQNAEKHQVSIEFLLMDILQEPIPLDQLDVVVSNPPYIPDSEKDFMGKNVIDYEPEKALFVPDEDPLIFYRHITRKALPALKKTGKLYFEVHEDRADEVKALMEKEGLETVEIFTDLHGKKRMVRGTKN